MFDMIVVVDAKQDAQLERMRAMRGMNEETARARIAAQAVSEDRAAIADWLIENDGSLEQLEHETDRLWVFLEANRGGRTAH
jgi:dephospho-CoA kinase